MKSRSFRTCSLAIEGSSANKDTKDNDTNETTYLEDYFASMLWLSGLELSEIHA